MKIQEYIPVADFLSAILGENTEVVIHDFTDINHSIVYILNGNITNRKIGDTITDLVLKHMIENSVKSPYITNYKSKTSNDVILNSSTLFIYNNKKKLIGALCTNTDLKNYTDAIRIINSFIPNFVYREEGNENGELIKENFYNSNNTLRYSKIEEIINRSSIPPERMTIDEKMNVVHNLQNEGVFMLKGSVSEVAECLKVSEATIYRYIRANKK